MEKWLVDRMFEQRSSSAGQKAQLEAVSRRQNLSTMCPTRITCPLATATWLYCSRSLICCLRTLVLGCCSLNYFNKSRRPLYHRYCWKLWNFHNERWKGMAMNMMRWIWRTAGGVQVHYHHDAISTNIYRGPLSTWTRHTAIISLYLQQFPEKD